MTSTHRFFPLPIFWLVLMALLWLSGCAAAPETSSRDVAADVKLDRAIDLNSAGFKVLETLPGIGPVNAKAIIDHRNKYGPFNSKDDLVAAGILSAKGADRLFFNGIVKVVPYTPRARIGSTVDKLRKEGKSVEEIKMHLMKGGYKSGGAGW